VRHALFICLFFSTLLGCQQPSDGIQAIADDYLDGWAGFYPSRALSAGRIEAASRLEDFSSEKTEEWVIFNRQALARVQSLPGPAVLDDRIDRQLLEGQIRRELFRWVESESHRTDPQTFLPVKSKCLSVAANHRGRESGNVFSIVHRRR